MPHMSRRQYQEKQRNAKKQAEGLSRVEINRHDYSNANINSRSQKKMKLNVWQFFEDRPYVTVITLIVATICVIAKWWLALAIVILAAIIGIFVIGHSKHPDRVLSLEFHMKSSRKLSVIKAIQLLGSMMMFLAAYMRQIVSVDFSSAGTNDGLSNLQGILSSRGGYAQQGSYFLSLFNQLTGGSLWSTYRYATNSSQMMNSTAGSLIIMWIFLLMIAPALCVLSQFFKEPYSRHVMTVASVVSLISFVLTPTLMKHWVVSYAIENQMSQASANKAVQTGSMVYIAIVWAVIVVTLSVYREIKRDNFE